MNLTPTELITLEESLDAYVYWQLSDEHYRKDGAVLEPGSDDPTQREEMTRALALRERIDAFRREHGDHRDAVLVVVHDPECDMDEDCTCDEQPKQG